MITALAFAAALAGAPPQPTADEIRRVYEYWSTGKDHGPVLLSLELCASVEKVDGKWTCKEPLPLPAGKGAEAIVLFKLFVPKDAAYDDVKLEVLADGETKLHKEYSVSTSWSYGTYAKTRLTKAGAWEVRISRGDKVLGTTKVTVE